MYRVLGWTSRPSPRPWSALLVAIAGVVTFACSDDPVEPEISQSAALRVTPFAAQQLAVGDTLPLTAQVLDQNGEAVTGKAVTWASDNTLVATVDTTGVVTAVGEGAATITAESGGIAARVQFVVADPIWAVLYALYVSTGGDDWTNNENWLSGAPLQTWYGVIWDPNIGDPPCHLSLELEGNNLTGEIPPELGDLACLEELDLSGNRLKGDIPPEVADLPSLWRLDLSGNQLTGSIPVALGKHWRLQELDLSSNELGGSIPVGSPQDTSYASQLRVVSLDNNRLAGPIPADLGGFSRLTHLQLRGNSLTGAIPAQLGNLQSLRVLRLSDNELTGTIPPEIGNLSQLDTLWLSHNRLSGRLPSGLGSLSDLDVLWLSHNDLTGIVPAALGELSSLKWLLIGDNSLVGPLPLSLKGLGLDMLGYANTNICLPADESFRAWLDSIPTHEGTEAECGSASDRAMLEAFYHATGGPQWRSRINWLSERPLGEWRGVDTDSTGRVVRLRIARNNLVGQLPPEIGGLTTLRSLYIFSEPGLTGEIPREFGNLTKLETLLLRGRLVGGIPPELGDLVNLQQLNLVANRLTGTIPPELGNLSNLVELNLVNNNLVGGIPPELGGLANLHALALYGNDLTGVVPPELGDLESLTTLRLHSNPLVGPLPLSLADLELEFFTYWGTRLCAPVDERFQSWLASITYHNGTGMDCTDRHILEVFYQLTGGPDWTNKENWLTDEPIGDWYGINTDAAGRVVAISLDYNNLVGAIPSVVGDLSSLKELVLISNQLAGRIPPEIGNLSSLEDLNLFSNQLTGAIPPEIANLSNLESLALNFNQLTGSIPPEIGNLSSLEDLALNRNQLTGSIPSKTGGLSSLKRLDLSYNKLTDSIPPGIDSLLSLEWLNLRDNQLTGAIPPEIGSLSSLERLSLYGNKLAGAIPPEIGSLSSLKRLDLSYNKLTGAIPREIGNLSSLKNLFLHDNQLTDSIPSRIGDLSSLEWLDLRDNQLTGPIPPEIGNLSSLKNLYLYDNQLTGSIPPEIGNLSSLGLLGLAYNQLTGLIPPEIGNMEALQYLQLHYNPLRGPLPLSLAGLTLQQFGYVGSELCVPRDESFRAWLESIPSHFGTGVDCPISDRAILEVLYNETDGSSWYYNTNWLTDAALDDWYGVDVDSVGRVIGLHLSDNGLSGPIPPELGGLDSLATLILGEYLTGSIPPELGDLEALVSLRLEGHSLTGPIPSELGGLTSLTSLLLFSGGLSGPLPLSLTALPLQEFFYGGTLCVPADESFRTWLDSIPDHSGTGIDCTSTDRDILTVLYNATNGSSWYDNRNWLTDAALDAWYGVDVDSVGRVIGLRLSDNGLRGPIPPELGGLDSLATLELGEYLTGSIPPELGDLEALDSLRLEGRGLTGPLPLFLTALPLKQFWYHSTNFCVPDDASLRTWLDSIPDHSGTGVDCTRTDSVRLDFDSIPDLAGWSPSPTTTLSIDNGILYVGSTQAGRSGYIQNLEFLDSVVTNWEARARMGRTQTDARMAFLVQTDHPRYQTYAFDLGSGVEFGPDSARVGTNWRVLFWDRDLDGPNEGGWIYFVDYGYGSSEAIDDEANEFTEMTFAVTGDSLQIQADSTLLFANILPPPIREAGATNIQGVWLAYTPIGDSAMGTALFDWIEVEGEIVTSAAVASDRREGVRVMMDRIEGVTDVRPAGIGWRRR